MRNIKLILQYDGTNFHGFSYQKNFRTVEQEIQKAISEIFKENVNIVVASRTDAGVHALGQVVNFKINDYKIPSHKISYALNQILPPDIVVSSSEEVPFNFNARFNAIGKEYCYICYNDKVKNPLLNNRALYLSFQPDLQNMQIACKQLIGKFDFEVYKFRGCSSQDFVREIYNFNVVKFGTFLFFFISGSGFLYKMVRALVGTILEIGRGKIKPDEIKSIISNKEKNKIGKILPPYGLYLLKVFY